MNEIRIDFSDLKRLEGALAKAPEVVREELSAAMDEADALLEREVRDLTPHAHGLLRDSIAGSKTVNGLAVEGFVGSSMSYVQPVELGTRPHFPPVEALLDWVKVKLGLPEKEARGVAFLIARKISRKGTEGAHMFDKGLAAVTPQLEMIFERAQAAIAARVTGNA